MKNIIKHFSVVFLLLVISTPSFAGIIRTYIEGGGYGINRQTLDDTNAIAGSQIYNKVITGCSNSFVNTGLGFINTNATSYCYQGGNRLIGEFNIKDLMFSKLPGFESLSDQITTKIHLTYFSGTFDPTNDNSNLSINVRLGSTYFFTNTFNSLNRLVFNTMSVLETGPYSLNINNTQSIGISGDLIFPTYTDALGPGQHYGRGNFGLRLGGSPVFVLQTGYTVNSKSANIVNNWYKGFNPLAKNVAVPEPSTLSVFLLAIMFFSFHLFKANRKYKT